MWHLPFNRPRRRVDIIRIEKTDISPPVSFRLITQTLGAPRSSRQDRPCGKFVAEPRVSGELTAALAAQPVMAFDQPVQQVQYMDFWPAPPSDSASSTAMSTACSSCNSAKAKAERLLQFACRTARSCAGNFMGIVGPYFGSAAGVPGIWQRAPQSMCAGSMSCLRGLASLILKRVI